MTKKRKAPAEKVKTVSSQIKDAPLVLNAADGEKILNGVLSDALGFGGGFPWNQGVPGTAPVEQVTSIFVNLRYYFVSNFRQILNQAYVEFGLVQTIVDVPVDDGLRGGVEIKSKQLDEDEIEKLQSELDRDDDINTAGQAGKWNRLFGGAGVLIITDQDPETPLDITAIGPDTPLQYKAVDMWELFGDLQNMEGGLNQELIVEGDMTNDELYSYYGQRVHHSRVMLLKGMVAPSFVRPRLRGWGFSVVEALVRSINQYLKATNLSYEVLDEFKLDVYKIKNLVSTLLHPNGVAKVRERVDLANKQKNYQHAVVMDSEDEFDHKQLSFSGLAEAMDGIRMQVAADMRMPITKLFGTSQSKGFATDQNDMEVYNSMVESQVRSKLKYHIIRMIEIKCQKLFGFIPDDLKISFKPLRVLSATDEETVKTSKFNRLIQAKGAGEITTFEFREGCNRDNLLSITLDTTGDALNPDDPDVASLLDGSDEVDEDAREGNPGADKPDAERPQLPKKKSGSSKLPSQRSSAPKLDKQKAEKEKSQKAVKNADDLLKFPGAKIVTVGLLSGGKILSGLRRDNQLWTNPGGHMDEGETPEEAAVREVKEETGIQITPDDLQRISAEKIVSHRTGKEFVVFAYLANLLDQPFPSGFDPDQEVREWKWVDLNVNTPELQPEARHAKDDAVLRHLFKMSNSMAYEVAAYEVDGGDDQFDTKREPFLEKLGKDPLWKKAVLVAQEAGQSIKFAYWWYLRQGGKKI